MCPCLRRQVNANLCPYIQYEIAILIHFISYSFLKGVFGPFVPLLLSNVTICTNQSISTYDIKCSHFNLQCTNFIRFVHKHVATDWLIVSWGLFLGCLFSSVICGGLLLYMVWSMYITLLPSLHFFALHSRKWILLQLRYSTMMEKAYLITPQGTLLHDWLCSLKFLRGNLMHFLVFFSLIISGYWTWFYSLLVVCIF